MYMFPITFLHDIVRVSYDDTKIVFKWNHPVFTVIISLRYFTVNFGVLQLKFERVFFLQNSSNLSINEVVLRV